MPEINDNLDKMIQDLDDGYKTLNIMANEKPLTDFRIHPTVQILLTAYRYLSTNLQTVYQYVQRS